MIRLTVREGGTVRTVRIEGSRLEIGAGPDAGLRVAGAGISRRHCLLRGLRRGFEVVDLGSREGTILNGTRVGTAPLAKGDTLTLGSASVVLDEIALDPAPATPPAPAAEPPGLRAGERPPKTPDSFELQLYRAVRGSPPLLASVAIHGAAVVVAILLTPTDAGGGLGPRSVNVSREVVLAPEEDAPRPDDPSLMPADLPLPDTEPDPDPVTAERLPPPREPLPVPSAPSTRGGDLRSVIAIGNRKAPPVEKPSEPEFDSNPTFEADTSDNANREAATLLRKGLGGGAGGERSLLGSLDPRRVHICQGCYDHVEKVLDLMGIRYDALKPEEVAAAPLAADGLLVIDCGVDRLDADAAASVRRFVEAGGYLCTTDWALENVLEPAFPGVLRSLYKSGRGVSTQKEIVHFRLAAPLHPLVRGLRPVAEGGVWWVEDQAHPIEIADTRRVVVLVESEEFRQRYGSAVLAVTFGWGKGRVLHLLGHAWQREGNLKGTYAMQRMILNFLLERAGTPTAERRETIQK